MEDSESHDSHMVNDCHELELYIRNNVNNRVLILESLIGLSKGKKNKELYSVSQENEEFCSNGIDI